MRNISLLLAGLMMSVAVSAADLTWNDLVTKPELRPAQCTLKKAFKFQSGQSVKAGQTMNILEFKPGEIVLSSADGRTVFGASPQDCDVLEKANALFASLTPRQQSLTIAEVIKTPSLWPYKLTLKDAFDVGGQRLKKGETVYLMDIKNGELVVVPPTFSMNFNLQPQDTDLMEKARQYVEAPYEGRVVEELRDKLVNAQTGQPMPLDSQKLPRYLVIYSGARWCPYCQKFTPNLVKAYKELKAKYPAEFEVVYMPSEKSAGEMQTYAKELNFPWPAVGYTQRNKVAVIAGLVGRHSLPDLRVTDRYGALVIDGTKLTADQVLAQFKTLVAKKKPS